MPLFENSKLPSKTGIEKFIAEVSIYLFPQIEGYITTPIACTRIEKHLIRLLEPIKTKLAVASEQIASKFVDTLETVKIDLEKDANLLFSKDPASTSVDEVIVTYPGFYAILVYRVAHSLALLDVPLIPRMITESAHSKTGIDIHPKATIKAPFFIDHGTGVVIGETSIIGENVQLYQGVTIGALSVKKEMSNTKRHPTIEDNVIIYAGSTILGGETIIGHDSIIGGNVFLTKSVPPFSLVYHEHTVKVRPQNSSDSNSETANS